MAQFNLINNAGSCSSYLNIGESMEPFFATVYRMLTLPELTLASNGPLTNGIVSINNSNVILRGNAVNISMTLEYFFYFNNYSIVKNFSAPIGKISS